ncbi:MAG: hypothetical protein PHO70_01120 [Candidatus Omnitrophica bacterium]|nr:hypothetical protein [Candidatus Omnitrophota bacterium]
MRRRNSFINAQSFVEYAVIIAVVAAAILAGRAFFVRALQAKYRQSADTFGQGEQYDKRATKDVSLDTPGSDLVPTILPELVHDCDVIRERVTGLETSISNLYSQADKLEQSAASLAVSAALVGSVSDISIKQYKSEATSLRDEAADKQQQVDTIRGKFPDCF